MRFLYLFLILPFFHLQATASDPCDIPEATKICAESCKADCTEPTNQVDAKDVKVVNSKPGAPLRYKTEVNGKTVPVTKGADGKFLAADYYFPGAGAPVEGGEEAPSCDSGLGTATKCCNDPVACLGGEHLSTFNQVNNIATQVGPGMSMLLQGTGKDMSGMCEALQAMAGAGAGLSTAALAKCKGSISSCYSACDKEIETKCQEYSILKAQCNAMLTNKELDPKAKTLAGEIVKNEEKTKPACSALNAKAGEIMGNLGQMANSALSAELCKKQASAGKDKEECAKAGGRWDGYRCITPEGECEKQDGIWDGKKCKSQQQVCVEKGSDWRWNNVECVNRQEECEEAQQKGVAVSWDPLANLGKGACRKTDQTQATVNRGDGSGDISDQYGGGINLNTETPGTNDEYDPDDPDNNAVGGGGSTPAGISSGGSPGSSDLLSGLKSSGTNPKAASPTNTAAGKGKSYSGGGRMGGFGSGFRGRRSGERASSGSDKDKPGLSMGGGGFSGYGGGSGDGDDSYASLGLSKKKLKELEKKAGAKRKAASEGLGGAHQNIFERITKRFQSLCKNKLDCR